MPAARYCSLVVATGICLTLGACQTVPMLPGLKPYRMDIQQGNVVTQEMVAKLKPGMTRQQVRFVMGTPPITDAFHHDRWDYVYYLNRGGRMVEHRRLVLLFEGDTLKRIEGDVIPAADAGSRFAGGGSEKPGAEQGSGKDASEEKGFFGRMLDKIGL
ncbi:MAG: outer membrane protein assembly factor BamE [Burkholderiales bacterium]|nr:outer membrane protein assembly factor BamE [Burkholderiales bacterium]